MSSGAWQRRDTAGTRAQNCHAGDVLTLKSYLLFIWNSDLTFSSSPTPESSFAIAFVKCVNPEMREPWSGGFWRCSIKWPDVWGSAAQCSHLLAVPFVLSLGLGRALLYIEMEIPGPFLPPSPLGSLPGWVTMRNPGRVMRPRDSRAPRSPSEGCPGSFLIG